MTVSKSISELLAHDPFIQAVARIKQQPHAYCLVHSDIDRGDSAHFVVIGDGGHGPLFRLDHLYPALGAIRQQGAMPPSRPEWTDRSKRHQGRADRDDRALSGEVVG